MTMWMHMQLIGAMWWHFCQWFFFLESFVCTKHNTQWIPMTFSRFSNHSSHSGWQHLHKLYIINSKCYFYRNDFWMKVKTVSSIKGLGDVYFTCHALILLYPFPSHSTAIVSSVRILSHDLSCINYVWSKNIYMYV